MSNIPTIKPEKLVKKRKKRKKRIKWDKDIEKVIIENLEIGMAEEDSAMMAGAGVRTYYTHKKNDKQFQQAIKKALLKPKKRCVAKIQADQSWQSKAWWLERKYKNEFGQRVEHTGKEGEPLQLLLGEISVGKEPLAKQQQKDDTSRTQKEPEKQGVASQQSVLD